MAALERERSKLQKFEREDQPAFERWMAAQFGHILTELRAIASAISEKAGLIMEIEEELFFGNGRSHYAAWRRVTARREAFANGAGNFAGRDDGNGDPFGERAGPDADPDADFDDPLPDADEQEEMFRAFVRDMLGVDVRDLPTADYEALLQEFKSMAFGDDPFTGERAARRPPNPREAVESGPNGTRLKELYRLLVRRLHPDVRADGDPAVNAVWHDVQAAYAAGDVARLETLLAFTDVRENSAGAQTTLSQWRSVIAELKAALNAVRRSLRGARKNPAWSFAQSSDHAPLEQKIGADLRRTLHRERAQLQNMEDTLALWSTPPKRRVKAPPKIAKARTRQSEFEF